MTSASSPLLLSHLLDDLPPSTLSALADTDLWVDDGLYSIVAITSDERHRFLTAIGPLQPLITIEDGDEFTVVLSTDDLAKIPPLLSQSYQAEHNYRFIRLEATLPWDTVGYGAAIFAGFYSGYSIDYLLVRDTDLKVTLNALVALVAAAADLLNPFQ